MNSLVCTQANPDCIRWSRKSVEISVEKAAKRVGITSDAYERVENGGEHLTLNQLRLLAVMFKRPVAVFFLPQPPKDTKRPKDYRGHKGQLSSKTILSFRKSRRIQGLAKDLMPDGVNTNLWAKGASTIDDAARARQWLGIDDSMQLESTSPKAFFSEVADFLATKEIHVLLHSFPKDDAQAYSFPEIPRIITVSTNDGSIEARLFSTLHELYHISMGESGLCFTNTVKSHYQHERLCDEFATFFLMPEGLVRKVEDAAVKQGMNLDEQLAFLNKSIKASKYALLIRLQELNYINEQQVAHKIAEWRSRKPRPSFGRTNRISNVLKENGKLFTVRVVDAYVNNRISTVDASRMLSVNQTYLDKVGARLNEG